MANHNDNKISLGLGNVNNTSDAAKPISTATAAALSGKEPAISAGNIKQYFRGDKTWQTQQMTRTYTATIASGVYVIHLTSDGTAGGASLFSGTPYVHLDFLLNDPNLGKSYAFSNSNKTLTITAVRQAFTGISVLSIPVLGSVAVSAAANGVQLSVMVQGDPA